MDGIYLRDLLGARIAPIGVVVGEGDRAESCCCGGGRRDGSATKEGDHMQPRLRLVFQTLNNNVDNPEFGQ